MKGLFIFRRDLRTVDNTSLYELSKLVDTVIPIFILTPEQIKKNPYFSNNSVQFMAESLEDLYRQTNRKLLIFFGQNKDVIKSILQLNPDISHIAFNEDYTPYSKIRDAEIKKIGEKNGVKVITYQDYTIFPREAIRDGYYKVFKPFYTRVIKLTPPKVNKTKIKFGTINAPKKFIKPMSYLKKIYKPNSKVLIHGGRQKAVTRLKTMKKFKNYAKTRNNPNVNTTLLSAYIKYGNISIREVYNAMIKGVGKNSELTRQVIWHDFYAILMYYLPKNQTIGGGNFKNKKIKWIRDTKALKRWQSGTTGVPIIDAAMRQLNTVGWMHNRCRLLVSNFLTMILQIDWHLGEKYFATQLIDYDVASNNLNWQFSSGIGTDRTPYVRVYNPYTQGKEIDPDAEYIKKWVPELKGVSPKDIHNWYKTYDMVESEYPEPMVDVDERMKQARKIFR